MMGFKPWSSGVRCNRATPRGVQKAYKNNEINSV